MREWQVGDPAGDGSDIGVPDIPYMGYLKEDGDDEPQSVPQRDFLDRVLDTTYILEPERTIVKSELERLSKKDEAYLSDGRYALIKFKLGSREIEKGEENLLKLKELIKKSVENKKSIWKSQAF